MEKYDSRPDTEQHIATVQGFLYIAIQELKRRQVVHDKSKLESPEKEMFDEWTPKLKESTYGSVEYNNFLKELKVGLDHHYANNDHHPEFYTNGIKGMNLISLLEMIIDWLAATKRHADGNIIRSIEINQKRFGYGDELKEIFLNTLPLIGGPQFPEIPVI